MGAKYQKRTFLLTGVVFLCFFFLRGQVDVGCGRQAFFFSSVGCSFAQKTVFGVIESRVHGLKPPGS